MMRMLIMFSLLVALLFTGATFAQDNFVEKFGISEGNSVDAGFVFVNGRYVKPPYVVSRRGLELFINNKKIKRPARHPGAKPEFNGATGEQLTEEKQQRLATILEKARKIYEISLRAGNCYVFSEQGGHKRFDKYVTVYHTPGLLKGFIAREPKFEERINELLLSLLHIAEFGETSGEAVDKGFMFVDGHYIDAPYVVTRKGLGLFVNNIMIQGPARWPIQRPTLTDSISPEGRANPEIPATINQDSSSFDPDVLNYLGLKRAYLLNNYSKEQAVQRIRDLYNQLPCVKQAKLDPRDPEILNVTWSDDSTDRVRLIPIEGRRPIKMDKQSILYRLNRQRENLEERLQKGDYYFLFSGGGQITGGAPRAAEILPRIVPILQSSKPFDLKFKEVREAGLPLPEGFEKLVTNFSSSSQLEARLNDLKKPKEDK